jgi:hypothetical protein
MGLDDACCAVQEMSFCLFGIRNMIGFDGGDCYYWISSPHNKITAKLEGSL